VDDLVRHPWILLDIAHHGVILYDPASVLERELDAVRQRIAALGSTRVELPDGSWYWDLKPDWRPGEVVDLRPTASGPIVLSVRPDRSPVR
jgi:hypothetical protein